MWFREVYSKCCVVQGNFYILVYIIMYLNGLEKCMFLCGLEKFIKVFVQFREVYSRYLFDLQKKLKYVLEWFREVYRLIVSICCLEKFKVCIFWFVFIEKFIVCICVLRRSLQYVFLEKFLVSIDVIQRYVSIRLSINFFCLDKSLQYVFVSIKFVYDQMIERVYKL